jgi:formate-dependent nitrite reductase cytochrome c552 subunit
MKKKFLIVIGTLFIMVVIMAFSLNTSKNIAPLIVVKKDSIASVAAFKQVYTVLMSARCMNCHPSGDVPLQGDDSHLHTMLPKRGAEGEGVYAMKCSNCHQPTNILGLHMPPGNPNWHLPPANMKMVFQGRAPNQLAKQLVNPKTNGNKTLQQLIAHADDGLVKAGWKPGEGRTLPPMSHAAFKKAWITWLNTGAYAPKK